MRFRRCSKHWSLRGAWRTDGFIRCDTQDTATHWTATDTLLTLRQSPAGRAGTSYTNLPPVLVVLRHCWTKITASTQDTWLPSGGSEASLGALRYVTVTGRQITRFADGRFIRWRRRRRVASLKYQRINKWWRGAADRHNIIRTARPAWMIKKIKYKFYQK